MYNIDCILYTMYIIHCIVCIPFDKQPNLVAESHSLKESTLWNLLNER